MFLYFISALAITPLYGVLTGIPTVENIDLGTAAGKLIDFTFKKDCI